MLKKKNLQKFGLFIYVSILLILVVYYKLSIEVLIPHFSGVKKFAEKKLILLNDFQKANSAFLSETLRSFRTRGSVIAQDISLFIATRFKKNKDIFELLFISPLILGLFTSALNDPKINKITSFLLSNLFICIFLVTCILFIILSYKVTIRHIKNHKKGDFENLKREIINNSLLTISKKSVFFAFLCFLFSTIMVYVTYRITLVFLFLGVFFLLRDVPSIKDWIFVLNQQNYEITKKFHDTYIKFHGFNKYCKWICFIYFIYFFIFCLTDNIFYNIESFESIFNKISQLFEPLYLMFLVFVNAILMDLFFEFVIMFSHGNFVLVNYGTLARRASKAVLLGGGGGGLVGAVLSYTPLVDLPGVNEAQIRFGRGYGYETPLDWCKGVVLNSYFGKSTVQDLAKKYGTNAILDGDSYTTILNNEPKIKSHLNQTATPMEQRLMGLRKY